MQRLLTAGKKAFLTRLAGALSLVLTFGLGDMLTQGMGQATPPPVQKGSFSVPKTPDGQAKPKPFDAPPTKNSTTMSMGILAGSLGPPKKSPPGRMSGGGNSGHRQGGSCCGGLGLGGGYGGEVTRTIRGTVKDAHGYPLHGVKVKARVHRQGPTCKRVKPEEDRTVYTDYDDGKFDNNVDGHFEIKEVLVGKNLFRQGKFEKFEPASDYLHYLHIVAQDISGNQFDKKGKLDTGAKTDKLDGDLPALIQLPDITLEKYYVVDDDLKIHLHKDLKSKPRSHEIRPNHPVADTSKRYQEEVKAVTRKLASLGFRKDGSTFLEEVATYDSPARQAVKLFQTLWFHEGTSYWFSKVDGKVDQKTLDALNDDDANGVIWTTNTPFEPDNGFTYATDNKWIHATIPVKLKAIATKSIITSASCAIGGPYPLPPKKPIHKEHRAGSEIDIRWISSDSDGTPGTGDFYEPLHGVWTFEFDGELEDVEIGPDLWKDGEPPESEEWTEQDRSREKNPLLTEAQAVAAGRTWKTRAEYSRAKTQILINEINALKATEVFFNDPKITGAKRVKGHSNHIHFSFPFDQADIKPAGTDGAPIFSR